MRSAARGDAGAICALRPAASPTGMEARLVERLGVEGDALVSIVAERGGQIAGRIPMLAEARLPDAGRADDAPAFATLDRR